MKDALCALLIAHRGCLVYLAAYCPLLLAGIQANQHKKFNAGLGIHGHISVADGFRLSVNGPCYFQLVGPGNGENPNQ